MMLFDSSHSVVLLVSVRTEERKLSVVRTSNAICPLVWGDIVC